MATSLEVIQYLRPTGGWVLVGNDYEGITFIEAAPFSKEEFEAAFSKCDLFLQNVEATKVAEKTALLTKLGITDAEAKLLLS
jgi:hypothetical protein